ncbi:MAG: hypothetical protein OXI96_10705 [Acidimicrobiaceae bacterium]|nr:hypothetical protein [Acidimicrobiaceae bacterium]
MEYRKEVAKVGRFKQIYLVVKPVFIVALPALAIGLLFGVVAILVFEFHPLTAIIPTAVLTTYTCIWLWQKSPNIILDALNVQPVSSDPQEISEKRLNSVVASLCTIYGLPMPALYVVETEAVNIAALGKDHLKAHLVLTRGALDKLDRLELEAIVSWQLLKLQSRLEIPTLLASVAKLLNSSRIFVENMLLPIHNHEIILGHDRLTVQTTRYPPALISAFKRIWEAPEVESPSAFVHLWLVAPQNSLLTDKLQPHLHIRINALQEL